MAKPRKKLEDWQVADAARLKALWDRREPRVTQAAFAVAQGIGETQGIIWQYLNGVIPLGLEVAVKFAEGLKCDVRDFSPRLADHRAKLADTGAGRSTFTYDVPQDEADELLAYFQELSKPQRRKLLTNLREVVESNDAAKARLSVAAKRPHEQPHAPREALSPAKARR